MQQNVMADIKAFTCLIWPGSQEVSEQSPKWHDEEDGWEYEKLCTNLKVNLSRLPPCRDNLTLHVWQVNHHLGYYKRGETSQFSCIQSSMMLIRAGRRLREACWNWCYCWPILPPSLIDFLEKT